MIASNIQFKKERGARRLAQITSLTAIGLALAVTPALAMGERPPADAPSAAAIAMPSLHPLIQRVLPAVVNISVREKLDSPVEDEAGPEGPGLPQMPGFPGAPFDQFFQHFFQQWPGSGMQSGPDVTRQALGSGFIIDPAGYVVTNNHVVADADRVTVILQDGTKLAAKIIGRDPKTDLALLKVAATKPLPYVTWGDSDKANVGDWVVAVGNPFGFGGTVSAGIVSARGRQIGDGPYDDFMQVDAAINKGNSGGPTFNLAGQVVGINTAIYSPNGGSVGIGFAIPSNLAKPIVEELKAHGKIERGWLGVQIQAVDQAIASSLGLPKPEGALVASVEQDGPAARAGIAQGDVILSFDHHPIERMRDLPLMVSEVASGHKVDVDLWRHGSPLTVQVAIAKMPEDQEVAATEAGEGSDHSAALDLTLAPLNSEWRQRLSLSDTVKSGAAVVSIGSDSPLAELGLRSGDVIESVDRKPVSTPREAIAALDRAYHGEGGKKSVLILLDRNGVDQFIAFSQQGVPGSNG